jgi:hypothetical protein
VAKGKKTGGRDFKKGNPGRLPGTVVIPKKILNLNRKEAEEKISKYLKMTPVDLEKVSKNPETLAIDLLIISVIMHAMKTGDYTRLNFLFDRTIGRVKEKIDVSNEDGTLARPKITVTLPSNGREKSTNEDIQLQEKEIPNGEISP